MTDQCPGCDADPGSASAALAPAQEVCPNTNCPIVSWRSDRTVPERS